MKFFRSGLFTSITLVQLICLPSLALAGSFVVTRMDDPTPDGCNSGVDCSLREAVIAANANPDTSVITFQNPGVYELTIAGSNENDAMEGDLDINEEATIEGLGSDQITIDASAISDRVFQVKTGITADFFGFTATQGSVDGTGGGGIRYDDDSNGTLEDVSLIDNSTTGVGGGLSIGEMVNVMVNNSLFEGNFAGDTGGGIFLQGAVDPTKGTLQITQSRILGNMTDGHGGGISNQTGTLTIEETEISGNTADFDQATSGDGGGINSFGNGVATIRQSLISNNAGMSGGGVQGRNMVIVNSTITGNRTTGPGGPGGGGNGGGINVSSTPGNFEIYNSTITLNEALRGGGLQAGDSDTSLVFSNTINAQNISGGDCSNAGGGSLTGFTSLGYNLGGDDTCDFNATGDDPSINAKLDPLADNGGFTDTHALASDSPALNAGNPAGCEDETMSPITVDQRNATRPQPTGGRCDIGAVEMGTADLAVTKTVAEDMVAMGDPIDFEITVTNNGPNDALAVMLVDTLPSGLGFLSVTPEQGNCEEDAGILSCDLGTIASGGSVVIALQISADQEGIFSNTVTVSSGDLDPDPDNNTASVGFIVFFDNGGGVISSGGCSLDANPEPTTPWLFGLLGLLSLVIIYRYRSSADGS